MGLNIMTQSKTAFPPVAEAAFMELLQKGTVFFFTFLTITIEEG